MEMLHQWYEAIDVHGSFIRVLLVDYCKAFDLINQDILINKLSNTGISPFSSDGLQAFYKMEINALK